MRGPQIINLILAFLPFLNKGRREAKALEAMPEILILRERFREAFKAKKGFTVKADEVQTIGRAIGLKGADEG